MGIPNRERGRFLTVFTNSLFMDWSVRKIGLEAARLGEGQAVAREGFGDGESRPSKTGRDECRRSHPQAFDKLRRGAALEAATLRNV